MNFLSLLNPALLGVLFEAGGAIATAAGQPAIGLILADPNLPAEIGAVVSSVADVVTKVSPVVQRVRAAIKPKA